MRANALDGFRTPLWLRGANFQSSWGRLARPRRAVRFRREALSTPDGDELLLDHVDGPGGSPRALLLHGLEGSSNSVYIQGLASLLVRRGWRVTALNFRSCARDGREIARMIPNKGRRLYHSGETSDLGLVVKTLAAREPHGTLAAIGASLGGNALLKWLGENPGQAFVSRAATLSVPYDLAAGSRFMEQGSGWFYVDIFLETLRPKTLALLERYPDLAGRVDRDRLLRARTFWEFDDAATAPVHGFADAADYYARSSSLGFLPKITTPTLCLSAKDDPFLPSEVLTKAIEAASPSVRFLVTEHGGHVGFVDGWPWRPRYWGEERAVQFVAEGE